ncbi:NADH dehydrogenase [ubiquinone] 1 alpha subcomplex subunit 6-like [Styela clava]|uniref:NADH dehydrogenase [ubiquinone] 1 alpha subcomplex subunit 6-like n=1 Tax=Styela clava TaxID=7725 RepID=UPI00193A4925|nr:NADH dehydrogenase [ubiquinone] 1 alpha subcomplex subunit 6-like [Styela clava]
MAGTAGRAIVNIGKREIKPFMSNNRVEARLRVLNLYKTWYRAIPEICFIYRLPAPAETLRDRIKEEFFKNSHVRDVRAIDYLVVKGRMELQETMEMWKQTHHILYFLKHDSRIERPTTFLSKFFTQK